MSKRIEKILCLILSALMSIFGFLYAFTLYGLQEYWDYYTPVAERFMIAYSGTAGLAFLILFVLVLRKKN